MRAIGQAHRGRGARHFFHRHGMRQVAHAGAAVLFGHRNAEQAEVTQLFPHVHRKGVVMVDLRGARRQLRIAHAFDGIAQGVGIVGDMGIENHIVLSSIAVPPAGAWYFCCRRYFAPILMAPSSRITSPFSTSFSMMCLARAAYSSGRPRRGGNRTCAPREARISSDMPASIRGSEIARALGMTRIPDLASPRANGRGMPLTPALEAA